MKYKLKNIFDLQMGKTPSRNNTNYWNTNDYEWISIADLSKTEKYITDTKEYLSTLAIEESGIKVIPANTVVMSFKLSIGKTAITGKDMYCNEAIMAFHDKHVVDILPEYIYYMFKYRNWDNGSNKAVMGKTLNKSTLSEVEIDICSIEKQKEIVTVLDKVMESLSSRKKELALFDELVRGRFVELFGDVRHEEKYKGIPLRELCMTVSGGTPSTKFPEYYKGNIPWISTVSLGPDHIDGSTAKGYITQEAIENSATKLVPTGNILFGTRVGVGKSSLNDVDICTNQDIVAIIGIDENRFSRLFIKHVLDAYQPYFDSIKKGATILGITGDDLKDSLIPDAPFSIQMEYEKFVNQIDKSKFRGLSMLTTMKSAYEQQALIYS